MESLEQEALRILGSTTCVCGSAKERGDSFCRKCYFSLTPSLRGKLYAPLSDGYASMWDEARDYLRTETDRIST